MKASVNSQYRVVIDKIIRDGNCAVASLASCRQKKVVQASPEERVKV
jgi:hypothetical protein